MRRRVTLDPATLMPSPEEVLEAQGVPPEQVQPLRIRSLAADAVKRVQRLAYPVGVEVDVDAEAFARLYLGEGLNDAASPLPQLRAKVRRLALFAVTLGEEASDHAAHLMDEDDFALAAFVDTAASLATERAVTVMERAFAARLAEEGVPVAERHVLAYSPGYCGWHTSGQRALFRTLGPEDVGITLGEACLMHPIKSCSGVLLAGTRAAHAFRNDFDCCTTCETKVCRDRLWLLGHTEEALDGNA